MVPFPGYASGFRLQGWACYGRAMYERKVAGEALDMPDLPLH